MSRNDPRPDKIARQLFFVGLAGLPWLWIVNIFYNFDRVYGRIPCCGDAADANENNNEDNAGILGLMNNEGGGGDENGVLRIEYDAHYFQFD